jgi:hypothetical protein
MAGAVALLAALAAISAIVGSRLLFDDFTPNHDEPVYAYQAETLRSGHLTIPAASHEPFFRPWLHGERDGRLFSVFQPVWPAELALAETLTGTWRTALAVDAAAAAVLLYLFTRELLARRAPALTAAALLTASPFFLLQSATRLSYTLALALALLFGWTLLRAVRSGQLRWFAASGAAWSVLAVDRPLDGALLGGAGCLYLLLADRRLGVLARRAGAALAGAAPALALGGAYNAVLTGAPWRFPLTAAGGDNSFGFGVKRLTPSSRPFDFTAHRALRAMVLNLAALPHWSAGGLVVVPLAVAGAVLLWQRGQRRAVAALACVLALFPLVNLLYWGNVLILAGRRIMGPHYYLDLLVPVVVLAGVTLVELGRRGVALTALVVVAMVGATAVEAAPKLRVNQEIACTNAHDRQEVQAAGAHEAIVLLPTSSDGSYVLHPFPNLGNPPDLRADVLYAADVGGRSIDVLDRYPGRRLYRLTQQVPKSGDVLRRVPVVDRLHDRQGIVEELPFEVTNRSSARVVTAFAYDGRRYVQYLLDRSSSPNRTYRGRWRVGPNGITFVAAGAELVAARFPWRAGTGGTLSVGVSFGPDTDLLRAELFETRIQYRVASSTVRVVVPGAAWHRIGDRWFPGDVARSLRFGDGVQGRRFPRHDPCERLHIRFRAPERL